jgi:hypothetical protein
MKAHTEMHVRLFVRVGVSVPACKASRSFWQQLSSHGGRAITTNSAALANCPQCRQLLSQQRDSSHETAARA